MTRAALVALALGGCLAPEVRQFDEDAPDAGAGDGVSATALGLGDYNGCVVTPAGAVQCWGPNNMLQLGVESTVRTYAYAPATVPGVTGAVAVEIGLYTICALDAEGVVSCWGDTNLDGDGDASTPSHAAPVTPTGLAGVRSLTLSGYHACAIRDDDTLACWGIGGNWLTGAGVTPGTIALTGVTDVSLADSQGCAVACGDVWCWGGRLAGWLGDGVEDETVSFDPVQVVGVTGAIDVVVGPRASCAALADGTVMCWGDGRFTGGTPNPDTCVVASSGPYPCQKLAAPVPGLTGVAELAAGAGLICARRADGTVACWGYDGSGETGSGSPGTYPTPVEMMVIDDATAIEATSGTTCVIRADTTVWCTGAFTGYLDGTTTTVPSPVPVPLF